MKWVIDIDGTIDSNVSVFSWLTYHLKKPPNDNFIIILSCRNPLRKKETLQFLQDNNIYFDEIIFMKTTDPRDHKSLLKWKLHKIIKISPNIWIDNEIKLYKQIYKINLKESLPNTELIHI